MEVVDPDACLGPAMLEDRVREALVDLDVAKPRLGRDPQPVAEVVEERPERVVADAAVEVLFLVRREEDGDEVVLGEVTRHLRLEDGRHDRSRPADPDRFPTDGAKSRGEPARGLLELEAVVHRREPHGQAVAGDHE
jgi:hypothetical protein